MNRSILGMCILGVLVLLANCSGMGTEIARKSQSEKANIFSEIREDVLPAKGLVDLTVRTSVKTHVQGRFLYEPAGTQHGASEYPFILNIDGQAVTWMVPGEPERTPHDRKGRERDEGGEGMRYDLLKRIRLKPGTYTVFFALPGERVSAEVILDLQEGTHSVLEFVPLYRPARYHGPRFSMGVDRMKAYLDGDLVKND